MPKRQPTMPATKIWSSLKQPRKWRSSWRSPRATAPRKHEAAADEAFDAAFEEGSIDSLIETAAGGDDFGFGSWPTISAALHEQPVFSVDAGGPGLGGGLSNSIPDFVPEIAGGGYRGPATVSRRPVGRSQ